MLSSNMSRTPNRYVIAIALVLALETLVSSRSVTSRDVCLSNLECPSTSFCSPTGFSQLPVCVPRRPKNDVCVDLDECKQGLACTFDDTITSDYPTCRPLAPRNASCLISDCVDPLICESNSTTCQPFTDGFAGDPCQFDGQCQQDKGFYCQTRLGVCAPKRGPGEECDRAADNFECLGFCKTESFDDGICVSARKEGDLCTDDTPCENRYFDTLRRRADLLKCNIPKGPVGRCVRESRLIIRLGEECDPDHDRCDARRTLSCHPTRDGDHVCQHRVSRFESKFPAVNCEPQSRLSRCPWGAEKTECRLERDLTGFVVPTGPSPFFRCRRQSEKVARGGVCATEFAACESGTECREVPGVRPRRSERFGRFSPPRIAFCAQIAQKGEFCGDVKDKFRTQCGDGLRCVNGTCANAEKNEAPFDETLTHTGLSALCSDLPCAPGLVCGKDEFLSMKRCVLPLRIVGKGAACSDRAIERRRCENGLVCVLAKDGTNIRRCRKPRQAGDYCQENEDCAKGLVCPVTWTENREQEERRCYDANTTLSLGETCDPGAGGSQARCVVNERPDKWSPRDTIPEPMRCLMKGDGFACRTVVGLFVFCDESKDIVCDSGLECGNLGICVPAGEI